jgi:hypothetical protein
MTPELYHKNKNWNRDKANRNRTNLNIMEETEHMKFLKMITPMDVAAHDEMIKKKKDSCMHDAC